jgi:inhibitor of cysteine peptidase
VFRIILFGVSMSTLLTLSACGAAPTPTAPPVATATQSPIVPTQPPPPTTVPPTSAPGQVQVTQKDNGKTFDLAMGGVLEITLEGNPTTGYSWQVMTGNETVLKQMGEPVFTPESNLIGAPGVEVWKFQAVGAGAVALKLGYKQWWDKAMEPNPTFQVTVNVGGGASAPAREATAKDNGKTFDLAKGGALVVTLEGAPGSTGYVWTLVSGNDAVLKPQFDPTKPLDVYTPGAAMPGAPGTYAFKFQAIGVGAATLKFIHRRPWEPDDPQAETFTITVNVK